MTEDQNRTEEKGKYGHPLQYAFWRNVYVGHTEKLSDDKVRRTGAGRLGLRAPDGSIPPGQLYGPVERFNRCPTCEQWSPCDVRAGELPHGE